MKNTIYTDADLNALLLRCEEYDGNMVEIVIDADSTANQELTIAAGDASIVETITSGTRNTVEIPRMIWNFGGSTTATLSKNGIDAETITLTFPAAIDVDAGAALNETGTANEYRMDGSQSLEQQITSLQQQLQTFSMQTIDYILPSAISQADIADGSSNTVLTFEISCDEEDSRTAMLAEIQFLAETTVTGSTYGDLLLTASIALDGNAVGTLLKTYRDGRQTLKIDYLFENLSKGNHEMTVTLSCSGGALSLMQIFSAFLLAAKSTGDGEITVQPFYGSDFEPGVLADGLNKEFLTKEAYLNGTENNVLKILKAAQIDVAPSLQDLSAFFLTEYVLVTEMKYGTAFYTDQGMITRATLTDPTGSWDTHFNIPIKRQTGFNRISCDVLNTGPDNQDNAVGIFAVAIVDGVAQIAGSNLAYNAHTWTTITGDISALPYVDYIQVFASFGTPFFKNIRLLKV